MRYAVLLASVLIQMCLGGLYAWSSFVPALRAEHGLTAAQTQVIFGALITVFTVAMVYAGRLLDRRGPQLVAAIGGVLFGGGYVLASMSGGSFWIMFIGISLLAGIGTGFCYVCPLAAGIRWFPANKGLVTGLAVAGFGGGAIILACLAESLFDHHTGVLTIFRWIGLGYGLTIMLAALVLRFPATHALPGSSPRLPIRAVLGDRFFWALWLGMFCGTFAGLLVIGDLKPLALAGGICPIIAAGTISAFAAGNATGRIIGGWLADRLAGRSITLSLALLAGSLVLLGLLSRSASGIVFASVLVGFGFGSCFVIYAAQVSCRYGPDRVAAIYPLVFLGYGLSGVCGPVIGGWLCDQTGSYLPGIALSVAVVIFGLGCYHRLANGYRGSGVEGRKALARG